MLAIAHVYSTVVVMYARVDAFGTDECCCLLLVLFLQFCRVRRGRVRTSSLEQFLNLGRQLLRLGQGRITLNDHTVAIAQELLKIPTKEEKKKKKKKKQEERKNNGEEKELIGINNASYAAPIHVSVCVVYHLILLSPSTPLFWLLRNLYTGDSSSPLTSILAITGKLTP